METLSDDEGAGHEALAPPLATPAVMYEGLDITEPYAFSIVVASPDPAMGSWVPHHVEPSGALKPAEGPFGHGRWPPPPAPFCRGRKCMAMACCCSSCVILLGITLGIVLPIVALLSTAQVPHRLSAG